MNPALVLLGLVIHAIWTWRASVACARSGHRALRIGVFVYAALLAGIWLRATPFGTDTTASLPAVLDAATTLWMLAIAPGSLLIAGIGRLTKRSAAAPN